jgi:hypothetical protein
VTVKFDFEKRRNELKKKYKFLIEDAYNFRQIDSALSDFYEFSALQLLNELNQLNYLNREPIETLDS